MNFASSFSLPYSLSFSFAFAFAHNWPLDLSLVLGKYSLNFKFNSAAAAAAVLGVDDGQQMANENSWPKHHYGSIRQRNHRACPMGANKTEICPNNACSVRARLFLFRASTCVSSSVFHRISRHHI